MTGRATIIYNPVRVNLAKVRKGVASAEAAAGWAPSEWVPTTEDAGAAGLVDEAVAAGARLVIAAGGDGTVRDVGTAMRHRDIPFGIIPCGTANLLARNLRLPLNDTHQAARIAFGTRERRIDVGLLDYRLADDTAGIRPYLVMAGFGIDADMVAGTDPLLKRRFGWIAYVGPILRALRRTNGDRVTYSLDGGSIVSTRAHTILVGNCGTVTAGIRVLPEAEVDDGFLDVLAIRSIAFRDRARVVRWLQTYNIPMSKSGSATDRAALGAGDALYYTKAQDVTMTMERGRTMQADGDAIGDVIWARFRVDAGCVRMRVAS